MLKAAFKYVLGIGFMVAGLNHFWRPGFYLSIMPTYLPLPLFLVYFSGSMEIVLGALLLVEQFTRLAAWGLVGLLIAVFPANVHMATHMKLYPGISPVILWLRLPLQAVLIAWALWYTKGKKNRL